MLHFTKVIAVIVLLGTSLTSCLYRMPQEDDDLHSLPITNNPHVLNKPAPNLIPGQMH